MPSMMRWFKKSLKGKYGFKTKLLLNAKKDETLDAIISFTDNAKDDNLLIYYAGHGQLDKKQKRGYWLPKDSGSKKDSKWLSNNRIKDEILSSEAGQILLIVDSCFSGSLTRSSGDSKSVERLNQPRIDRLLSKKTRLVITSGGNEDGKVEAVIIDENENGVWEITRVDENQDGTIDYVLLDEDEDGKNDLIATDVDNDGKFDKVEPIKS